MKCTIAVGTQRARKASLQLSVSQPPRCQPPHTELSLVAGDVRGTLGTLVLNCIDLGLLPADDPVFGKSFAFNRTDESGTELGESVFTGPDDETFELSRLEVRFGLPEDKMLPLEVDAACYGSSDNEEFVVRIRAVVAMSDA